MSVKHMNNQEAVSPIIGVIKEALRMDFFGEIDGRYI